MKIKFDKLKNKNLVRLGLNNDYIGFINLDTKEVGIYKDRLTFEQFNQINKYIKELE